MPDLTKYDVLLNELLSIESQLKVYKSKTKDIFEKNRILEKRVAEVTKENKDLKQKVDELLELLESRNEEENNLFGSLNSKEKEMLKVKIRNLISRIDYHLSS
jgi:chromosome segregation ATPase